MNSHDLTPTPTEIAAGAIAESHAGSDRDDQANAKSAPVNEASDQRHLQGVDLLRALPRVHELRLLLVQLKMKAAGGSS